MQIREATKEDTKAISLIHHQAFDSSEANLVANFAIDLLNENHPIKILSLVAVEDDKIIGHTAFSPVYFAKNHEHFGYILAPLAVSPDYQHQQIGSSLIKHGLDYISSMGSFVVFVYGDPQYYSRIGFETGVADIYTPSYKLQFPEGWQALKLNLADYPDGGELTFVNSLNKPNLW